ncbi:uncharacterized protein DUF4389 [Isoptericola jiangsuensis]|uniref:Uncharacterized protein DUF4389 n=1 Tax=Isoptericola jiangsuensis TaxID=548579 RepID=A0A2A9EZU4_9MICO|nr:DUF4389 domain-containing protein [Isoptericola jiangsuensis]PFG43745.1 uncharacterized protein DUF4389 [Isoptericola jiangsuensis]
MTSDVPVAPGPPVLVDADPPTDLSRGLWLVKWLLLFPHVVVLVFLWLAFVVLTVVAFVAILFTARYPAWIFRFTAGVLRWSWRVSYYGYGALGTDRYPPFTLADVPDYPARLEITPPGRLSRGLVLVKWWLLALPHYAVVTLFLGASGSRTLETASGETVVVDVPPYPGLVGLLVLFAAVVLLFRARYPRGMFDLVMGMQRWVWRVTVYAGLMTDVYPPFRLDLGARDPARPATSPPGGTP